MATHNNFPTLYTNPVLPPPAFDTSNETLVRLATSAETAAITFPTSGYVGVAADFAEAYAREYESPKEFFYWDCLALIGAIISGRVRADFDLPCQPRLYLVKVAKSAWRRKSTSTQFAEDFLEGVLELVPPDRLCRPQLVHGAGSAEGLGQFLMETCSEDSDENKASRRVVLIYDEFRRFQAKAGIANSALLPMVNELYERNTYANVVSKDGRRIIDGHLVFLSNSTEGTYKQLLNAAELIDIGFVNRLFVVTGDSGRRVARPKAPSGDLLHRFQKQLAEYIAALLPVDQFGKQTKELVLRLTPEADRLWQDWYFRLEECDETARLDNLGMRLMGLLAFTSGKSEIDQSLLRSVLDILEYERQVRSSFWPIDATSPVAAMEQKIRRVLKQRGPLDKRDIRRFTNADRAGMWVLESALRNLIAAGDVRQRPNKEFELAPQQ